jgi:hypothetical protein
MLERSRETYKLCDKALPPALVTSSGRRATLDLMVARF